MAELRGISCHKENTYCLFCINEFTDEIKDELRTQFAAICHGEEYAGSGRLMYSYHSTVKAFLERYEGKTRKIQIGMIGELLIHLLMGIYFKEYEVVTPFFNLEEKSIKKGYDVVLTERDNPIIWLTEVKSGQLHKNKNANQTMVELLSKAQTDLKTRLNEENETLWHEAINGAKIAFDTKNTMKDAVMDILMSWGDRAYSGNNTSKDKNVILSGVIFSDIKDLVSQNIPQDKQLDVEKMKIFNQVYVIALQKGTYDKVYEFIKEEAKDEKE